MFHLGVRHEILIQFTSGAADIGADLAVAGT